MQGQAYFLNRKVLLFTLAVSLLLSIQYTVRAQARLVGEYQLDREVVEIPFEYVEHQILVHGEAGGRKDLTLMVDTGASAPVLDLSLGLTGIGLADTTIQEPQGDVPAKSLWLDELRLTGPNGFARSHNIAILMTDLSQTTRALGRKVDGILGITFLGGFVVEIDYPHHILRFTSPRTSTVSQRKPDNQRTYLFDLIQSNPNR